MSAALNGNLSRRVHVRTQNMAWQSSPGERVLRKRLHRVGSPEAGQVTSVVRYQPGSSFPRHEHPEGEEILVLDGIFSDHQGDFPTGSYLLNPEGFSHQPHSGPGCTLFVKLRQYPGLDREQLAIDSKGIPWNDSSVPGVSTKLLYQSEEFPEQMELMKLEPGALLQQHVYSRGVEFFIINGGLTDDDEQYTRGDWLRLPPGADHRCWSDNGCRLYRKQGAVAGLRSDSDDLP